MELQTFIWLFVMVLGLLFYFMAFDALTALPGNILFFSGCIVACWGSQLPYVQSLFKLAIACLIVVLGYVAWIVWDIKKSNPKRKRDYL